MIYWTGVGSRSAADEAVIMKRLEAVGYCLTKLGWVLRSGAADGADEAFENGFEKAWFEADLSERSTLLSEIYLPWKGFNGHSSPLYTSTPDPRAMALAEEIHPRWKALSIPARKLHARNIHQVLGKDLDTPSSVVVCWTPGGKAQGGTRTAIVCAEKLGIPVVNLGGLPYSIDDNIVNTIVEMVNASAI